ncbi:MAG TPA: hypothetical protein VN628_17230 [Vicinamibacterales bacterium]|nr:hypothetical protein [Vicinamibacterales bacterium]
MRVTALFCAVAVLACAGVRPVRAQSLADIAKQEEERQKKVRQPAKVYTNKDLGTPPTVTAAPPADPAKPADAAAKPAADKPADDKKDAGPAKDQKYWSERKKALDAKLERDRVLADAMQSRINGLTTDFAARSDPAQRAVIERDRQRAVAELDGLTKSIKDDQKALADFDEEARKASVPPGWLR